MVVDYVKVVIKSGIKHTSQDKLRALHLLDRCLMPDEGEQLLNNCDAFVKYTAKKMMKRLSALASHGPKGLDVSESSHLKERGATIFLANEPDK